MKRTEEEKKMICEVLDKYAKRTDRSTWTLEQFKKYNDLLEEKKSGWYICNDIGWSRFIRYQDYENGCSYGIDYKGNWFKNNDLRIKSCCVLSTQEQAEERLSEIAEKMGFKEGVEVLGACTGRKETLRGNLTEYKGHLGLGSTFIMYDGKWATIIDDKAELKEAIKVKQKELDELIKQL